MRTSTIPCLLLAATMFAALAPPAVADDVDGGGERPTAEFPESWFYRSWQGNDRRSRFEGKPPPGLFLDGFINGNPLADGGLTGKIVVLDFWATWCGPCIAAIPDTNAVAAKYAGDGVVVLGVCTDDSGQERFLDVAREHGIAYPAARDPTLRTQRAWGIRSFPTLALIDREGIVRAIGLSPSNLDAAVAELLTEQPSPAAEATRAVRRALGDGLVEGDAERRRAMAEVLEGRPMPALDVAGWSNARHLRDGRQMPEGTKLVVLTFLTSGDAAAVERLAALHQARADEGVVVIGVLTDESVGEARKALRSGAIEFPAALDRDGRVAATYGADDGEPETYLIHPNGTVLAGDVAEAQLDAAVMAALGAL